MSNPNPTPPPQHKLDTLDKLKEHLGEDKYNEFIRALRYDAKPAKLREITGKGDSQIRRYKKLFKKEIIE